MTAPRIAYYTDASSYGGAETALARLLVELDPGFDVAIAGVDATVVAKLADQRPGASACVVDKVHGKRDVRGLVANARAFHQLRPQILQANLDVPSACQYALASCALVPSIRTIAVEQLPYPLDGALQLRLKRLTSRRLAAHVAIGRQSARDVEALVGVEPGSVRTIYNGVPDVDLERRPRPVSGPIIGSVGRLDSQKAYDVLLRALVAIPDATLVLIGDGPERQELERLAVALEIADRVRFEGRREDARHLLTTFDVFVLPSRFEGLPLAIIDAMLARLPVIATRVGSIAEAVIDGETGLLVPAEDPKSLASATRELLADDKRRVEMGARGRDLALRFSPAAAAREYERLYEEILSEPQKRRRPVSASRSA